MQLEICIDRIESALAAQAGGANRIEVCGCLAVGGTTPSHGLVEQCVDRCDLDVMMMIRPHGGGFCYNSDDLDTMLRDISVAKRIGVLGVVFGALTHDRSVDKWASQMLLAAARPLQVTFHRAFDLTHNPLQAIDDLLEMGVDRVLTSGQAKSAQEGTDLIRQAVERCGKRISVMAGAGINMNNVADIVRATGVGEVHASASVISTPNKEHRDFGFGDSCQVTCPNIVRELFQAMR